MTSIFSFSGKTLFNYFELICQNFITFNDEDRDRMQKQSLEIKLKKKILQKFFEFLHEEHKNNLNCLSSKGVCNIPIYKKPIFTIKCLHRKILEYSFWFIPFFYLIKFKKK